LVDNLWIALFNYTADYTADKNAKMPAAEESVDGDFAEIQSPGPALASLSRSHHIHVDADGNRVSPAGSAADDGK